MDRAPRDATKSRIHSGGHEERRERRPPALILGGFWGGLVCIRGVRSLHCESAPAQGWRDSAKANKTIQKHPTFRQGGVFLA